MKKVWILEGFISPERIEGNIDMMRTMVNEAVTDEQRKNCSEMLFLYENELKKHPDGYWLPYQGKTNYKQFCYDSKSTLRNMKDKISEWRVVEGKIDDNATTWVGYEIIKENDGVLRYLKATM